MKKQTIKWNTRGLAAIAAAKFLVESIMVLACFSAPVVIAIILMK